MMGYQGLTHKMLPVFLMGILLMQDSVGEIVFTKEPESTGVLLGQNVILDCQAVQTPEGFPLDFMWEYNKQPIYTSMPKASVFLNHSLYIPSIQTKDMGMFQCVVMVKERGDTAVKSKEATIVEAYIENFFQSPVSKNATEGEYASFECVSGKSSPPPVVHWEKDGVLFTGGIKEVATFGTPGLGGAVGKTMRLHLSPLAIEDEGVYRCIAMNQLTKTIRKSEPAVLTIFRISKEPQFLVLPPTNLLAAADIPLAINCSIEGWPTPEQTWYKVEHFDADFQNRTVVVNSSNIIVSENGTLLFDPLRKIDKGYYICNGTNELGTIESSPLNLSVAYLDIPFQVEPENKNVIAGERVTLECSPPSSFPPPTIIWYKDNQPYLERSGEFAVSILPSGDLYFSNIQLGDAGVYFCIATNQYAEPKSRTSRSALMEIRASPTLVVPPSAKRLQKGQLLTLLCKVTANPPATVTWYKNQEQITQNERVDFRDSNQELVIITVNNDDEGSYKCMAANVLGSVESQPVQVEIIVAPEILQSVEDVTTPERSTVTMKCMVYGDPSPQIIWYKDDLLLQVTGRFLKTSQGLEISNVIKSDEGIYRCLARNDAGEKSTQGRLIVQVYPVIPSFPKEKVVNQSQSLILICDALGDPAPVYSWTFDSNPVLPEGATLGSDNKTLIISSLQRIHNGVFRCNASNVIGFDVKATSVIVQERAQVPEIQGNTVIGQGDNLNLVCQVTGRPPPTVTWSLNGITLDTSLDNRISFPSSNSLTVKFVSAADEGHYECEARNAAGLDSKNVIVSVQETPLPPEIISVQPMSTTSIKVTWHPVRQQASTEVDYFVIQYKEKNLLVFVTYKNDIPSTQVSYEVDGLRPAVEYSFQVAGRNEIGTGQFSATRTGKTFETAPSSPRNFNILSSNATAVYLQWEVPAQPNGEIRGYQVHYKKTYSDQDFDISEIYAPSHPLQRYTQGGLKPFTTYSFKVRGATIDHGLTMWGTFTEEKEVTTHPAAPSAPPENVTLQVLSSSVIQVSWKSIPQSQQNGPLTGYIVTYQMKQDLNNKVTEDAESIQVDGSISKINITNLEAWIYYEVVVRGYNRVGKGPASATQSVRTLATAPSGYPLDLSAVAISPTEVRLQWKPVPHLSQNSEITGYIIDYTNTDTNEERSDYVNSENTLTVTVSNLEVWTEYYFRIQAYTTQIPNGVGPFGPSVAARTHESIPGEVSNITATAFPYSVLISWEPPQLQNGIITGYTISYVNETIIQLENIVEGDNSSQAEQSSDSRTKRETTGDNQLYRLSGSVNVVNSSVTITNLYPETTYVFSIAAMNGEGTGPSMQIMATTMPGSTTPMTTTTTTTVLTTTIAEETTTNDEVMAGQKNNNASTSASGLISKELGIIIAGAVAGGVLLIILLVLIIFCCTKRKRAKSGIYCIPTNANVDAHEFSNKLTRRSSYTNSSSIEDSNNLQLQTTDDERTKSTDSSIAKKPYLSDSQYASSTSGSHDLPLHLPVTHLDAHNLARSDSLLVERGTPGMDHQKNIHPMFDPPDGFGHLNDFAATNEVHLRDIPNAFMSPPQQFGFDNPAFDADNFVATPRPGYDNPVDHPGLPSQYPAYAASNNTQERRRNRMKRSTAAAIAAQLNRNTAPLYDDTDTLLNDGTEVVFDERTAL